jgi:hypothetical protein
MTLPALAGSRPKAFQARADAERSAMQRVAPGAGTFLGRRGRRNYFQAGAGICLQTARLPRPTEGRILEQKSPKHRKQVHLGYFDDPEEVPT